MELGEPLRTQISCLRTLLPITHWSWFKTLFRPFRINDLDWSNGGFEMASTYYPLLKLSTSAFYR
jgi:hypothetical protein